MERSLNQFLVAAIAEQVGAGNRYDPGLERSWNRAVLQSRRFAKRLQRSRAENRIDAERGRDETHPIGTPRLWSYGLP